MILAIAFFVICALSAFQTFVIFRFGMRLDQRQVQPEPVTPYVYTPFEFMPVNPEAPPLRVGEQTNQAPVAPHLPIGL